MVTSQALYLKPAWKLPIWESGDRRRDMSPACCFYLMYLSLASRRPAYEMMENPRGRVQGVPVNIRCNFVVSSLGVIFYNKSAHRSDPPPPPLLSH